MNELSLFSGAGGGLLATQHLLGWRAIGYVEYNDYCQRVLAARIRDGLLHDAPIFGDIRAFIDQGYAERYRGVVDVVSGGFPCQDISCAGRGAGIDGERSGLWGAMAEVVRQVGPRFVFVENSPMLTSRGLGRVLGDLASMGYHARWGVLSGAMAGCPAEGARIWIVATKTDEINGQTRVGFYSQYERQRKIRRSCDRRRPLVEWWGMPAPRGDGRMDTGLANRVERLEALGNGQVPAVAALAWEVLCR
jgi:DNA (cytosine-5)-methyltransferase 1